MAKQHKTHPAYQYPWSKVRLGILQRDMYLCQIKGKTCTTTATQVDHIVSVLKGGAWWAPENLRASCSRCNNARIDRRRPEAWIDGPTHIVLVVGPPGGGKSTYVEEHKSHGDLVVDYDQIAEALGGIGHSHGEQLHPAVMAARNALLLSLRKGETGAGRAWVVSANPDAERLFPFHEIVVCDPSEEVARARCAESDRGLEYADLVSDWYKKRFNETAQRASRDW